MAQLARNSMITRTLAGNIATAAGSSVVDGILGASVDMAAPGARGVMFISHVVHGGTGGAISHIVQQSTAAVTALSSQSGTTLSGTTSTVAAGSSATSETFVSDVYKPRYGGGNARFLAAGLTIASSCSVLGPQFAIQYELRTNPPSTSLGNSTGSQNGITGGVVVTASPST